MAGDLHCEN